MKNIIILVCLLALAGCSQRQVSREEWLSMTSHTFPGTIVETVLKTGDQVLHLSDQSDVTVSHSENKIMAYRKFMIYAVLSATMGRYEFDLQATQKGQDVETKLEITRSFSAVFGPEMKDPWKWREAHDLFYNRMEALLYGKQWLTCSEAEDKAESGWFLEPLCLLADDKIPASGVKLSDYAKAELQGQLEFEKQQGL